MLLLADLEAERTVIDLTKGRPRQSIGALLFF
jgi:hypothetical protein